MDTGVRVRSEAQRECTEDPEIGSFSISYTRERVGKFA